MTPDRPTPVPPPAGLSKAVFLDRDKTLIFDPGYLADPAGVRLLPNAARGLGRLAEAGYKLIVVTNQSGIARGLLTEDALAAVHAELHRQLAAEGVRLDAIYFCPFHPEATIDRYRLDSDDRKPGPGMLLRAAGELRLDLPRSWMIGDSDRDILAGRRAGCRTILINQALDPDGADFAAADLGHAADIILAAR